MATIKNTTTGEIIEMSCIIDGADILSDVLGGCGVEIVTLSDADIDKQIEAGSTNASEWAHALDSDDVAWWERWCRREERISEAYEDATEEQRKAYEQAIIDYSEDMERMQDAEELALGIAEE